MDLAQGNLYIGAVGKLAMTLFPFPASFENFSCKSQKKKNKLFFTSDILVNVEDIERTHNSCQECVGTPVPVSVLPPSSVIPTVCSLL